MHELPVKWLFQLLVAVTLVVLMERTSRADEPLSSSTFCPLLLPGSSPELARHNAKERLDSIETELQKEAFRARLWYLIWAGLNTSSEIVQFSMAATTSDAGTRTDRLFAGSASTLGNVVNLVTPARIIGDADDLSMLVHNSNADPCALVAQAETVLRLDAEAEATAVAWYMHLPAILVNLGAGAALGLGYGRWSSAALNAGIGITVSEIQILTKPTGAVRALDRYRSGVLTPSVVSRISVAPMTTPGGAGLSIVGTF